MVRFDQLIHSLFIFFRAAQSIFFPPVRGAAPRVACADSPESRSRTLKEALSTIVTLAVCINLATAGFVGSNFYTSGIGYKAALEGPEALKTWYE